MIKRLGATLVSGLFVLGMVSPASAVVITFDEFAPANANSGFLSTEYQYLGLTFVHTDDGSIWGGLSAGDPGNWDLEGTNGAAFLGYNGASYSASLLFDAPVSGLFFDVSRSAGSQAGDQFTASAYDAAANLLETITVDFNPVNQWSTVSFASTGIASVDWFGTGAGFHPYGVDNLNFAPVPEPGTLALLGMGLAGMATFRRRQRGKK